MVQYEAALVELEPGSNKAFAPKIHSLSSTLIDLEPGSSKAFAPKIHSLDSTLVNLEPGSSKTCAPKIHSLDSTLVDLEPGSDKALALKIRSLIGAQLDSFGGPFSHYKPDYIRSREGEVLDVYGSPLTHYKPDYILSREGEEFLTLWSLWEDWGDLDCSFEVGQDSRDLYARFETGQDAKDLFAKFEIQDTEDLPARLILRFVGSSDLLAGLDVAKDSRALLAGFVIRHSTTTFLRASFQAQVSVEFLASFVVRHGFPPPFVEYPVCYVFREGTSAPYDVMYDTIDGIGPAHVAQSEHSGVLSRGNERKLVGTGAGMLYVVYFKKLSGIYQIYVKESTDYGVTWVNETRVSIGIGGNQYYSAIAVDSKDHLHVVWYGGYAGNTQIYYVKFTDSWSTPVKISTYPGMSGNFQAVPSIAVDSQDRPHVVWYGEVTGFTGYQIWYAKWDGGWAEPVRISTYANMASHWQYSPSIAVDPGNDLHVVWYGMASGFSYYQIWYAKNDGAWISPVRISTYANMASNTQYIPCIAADFQDRLHVVWYGKATGFAEFQIWYAEYDSAWVSPVQISTYEGMSNYAQRDPSITVDSREDFRNQLYVVWEGKATGYTDYNKIWYARYTDAWAAPEVLQPTGQNTDANLLLPWIPEAVAAEVKATLDVGQDSADLGACFRLTQEVVFARFVVRHLGSPVEMFAESVIRHPDSVDLTAEIGVARWRDFFARFEVGQDSANLKGRCWIPWSYDLSESHGISFYWWGSGGVDQQIDFEIWSTSGGWIGKFYDGPAEWREIQFTWDDLVEIDLDGTRPNKSEIIGIYWTYHTHGVRRVDALKVWMRQDLLCKLNVIGQGGVELLSKAVIGHVGTPVELSAKCAIRHSARADLYAGLKVPRVKENLLCKLIIKGRDDIDLLGKTGVRHIASAELLGRSEIQRSLDLLARFEVGQGTRNLLCGFVLFDYIDFRTWIESDALNRLSQTKARSIWADMIRTDDKIFLYADFGADYWGDFTHLFDLEITAIAVSAAQLWRGYAYSLTNKLDDWQGARTTTCLTGLAIKSTGVANKYTLALEYVDRNLFSDADDSAAMDVGTTYYLKLIKSGTSEDLEIYSDAERTNLIETLSITMESDYKFRYLMCPQSGDWSVTHTFSGYVENLDLGF